MSVIWSENGQDWERKPRPFRPRLTTSDIIRRAAEPRTVPYKRARLWQVAILCGIGAVLLYWYGIGPLIWHVSQWRGK